MPNTKLDNVIILNCMHNAILNFDVNNFDGNLCEVNSKILEEFAEAQNRSDNIFILKSCIGYNNIQGNVSGL